MKFVLIILCMYLAVSAASELEMVQLYMNHLVILKGIVVEFDWNALKAYLAKDNMAEIMADKLNLEKKNETCERDELKKAREALNGRMQTVTQCFFRTVMKAQNQFRELNKTIDRMLSLGKNITTYYDNCKLGPKQGDSLETCKTIGSFNVYIYIRDASNLTLKDYFYEIESKYKSCYSENSEHEIEAFKNSYDLIQKRCGAAA